MSDTGPARDKPILTIQEVAERWSVSLPTVMKHVRDPELPLRAIPIGMPVGAGRARTTLRFRIETVQQFERERERTLAGEPQPEKEPPGRAGYDGPILTTTPRKLRVRRAVDPKAHAK